MRKPSGSALIALVLGMAGMTMPAHLLAEGAAHRAGNPQSKGVRVDSAQSGIIKVESTIAIVSSPAGSGHASLPQSFEISIKCNGSPAQHVRVDVKNPAQVNVPASTNCTVSEDPLPATNCSAEDLQDRDGDGNTTVTWPGNWLADYDPQGGQLTVQQGETAAVNVTNELICIRPF